jgi:hypothetical protein
VTVQLACRLFESKALPRAEVAMALRQSNIRGISIVQALIEGNPQAEAILEREFSRFRGPQLSSLSVDAALLRRLPIGLIERFLALPLVRERAELPVPLAVVDPFDSHILAEFRFCLGLAVTPMRVSYSRFLESLDEVRSLRFLTNEMPRDERDDETPAFGVRLLRSTRQKRRNVEPLDGASSSSLPRQGFTLPPVEQPVEPSEPPIPLVHTTLAPGPMAVSIPGTPKVPAPETNAQNTRDSEPVLKLVKQKPSMTFRLSVPPPPRGLTAARTSPEEALEQLEEARTPAQLIERVKDALIETAPCQAYFAVRGSTYVLKYSTSSVAATFVELSEEHRHVLETACKTGYCLGPLAPDGVLTSLGFVLGMRPREEIYAAPVNVSNRPALVLVLGRFDEAFAVTRWVDVVTKRAGQVLERLARSKKGI